ncbi:MAG: response regulator transcription factor [Clostridia bacterium]|nr:response regulator transcription factor [Clostridia bacterium]MBQ9505518.1 response regulator transcription factor [Clostridia bacterium]
MKKTRVMIVDDQAISRRMFEMCIEHSERYELAYSVKSAAVADIYLVNHDVELILMDILMNDGSNGLDAAEKIKKSMPEIRIVAVTSMVDTQFLTRARQIGVDSFWYKEADEVDILDVMDRTMAGESVYPDAPLAVRMGNIMSTDITGRELEVLREITSGASNAMVAQRLGITEGTVKVHVRNLLRKTGYASRTELAIKARMLGAAVIPEDMA